jgi:tripartite-type tricarboxylate transporter receptor subunit TctC
MVPYNLAPAETASRTMIASASKTLFLAALFALPVDAVPAQEVFPSRPVQIVVPAPAGGSVDIATRLIEARLSAALKSPVALLNRPGASGIVGLAAVSKAQPDGYTLGASVNSIFTVVHVSGSSVPFTLDDFDIVGQFAADTSVLCVSPEAPWQSFQALVEHARKNPGKLTYGSSGIGTVSSLSMESIKQALKLDITGVPFPGGGQLATAIVGKHVDMGMVPHSAGTALIRDNKLRPLLTTSPKRVSLLPDVPAIGEIGLSAKGFDLVLGLVAPKGVPPDVLKVLVAALEETMSAPDTRAKLEGVGFVARYEGPALTRERLIREYQDVIEVDRLIRQAK